MGKKLIPMAIAYDFDGTLAPGNMQDYDFIPALDMKPGVFWKEAKRKAKEQDADEILAYMVIMLEKARNAGVPIRKQDIMKFGKGVELFGGVEGWFGRINQYASKRGIKLEHYIISSGIREMIKGSKIGGKFKAIFASSFMYDANGVANWPALAINYTTKTQYLFRINKGNLKVYDNSKINTFVPKEKRPVPFENIVFLGDGDTDIPCMRMVKEQGGHSIAVYKPHTPGAKAKSEKLKKEGRVNFTAPANYMAGSEINKQVKAIINKVAADAGLRQLGKVE